MNTRSIRASKRNADAGRLSIEDLANANSRSAAKPCAFFSLILFSLLTGSISFAEQYVFSKSDTAEVVANLSGLLTEHYVFPDVAKSTALFLEQRLESGAYTEAENAEQLASLLSEDLQSGSKDGHLNVRPLAVRQPRSSDYDPEVEQLVQRREEKLDNYGLKKVEVLPGNVGYINMTHFSDHDSAKDTVFAMMSFLNNVDALIVDMRYNKGGNSDMLRYFSSYFLKPNTLLRKTYTRNSDEASELRTMEEPLPLRMYDVPLYVLTSRDSASAAEAFTNTLKEYERGIVIGEKTAGLANPGRVFRLNPAYKVNISTKRTVGPVSGTNWAGKGVIPHVQVTAEEAFDKAYLKAKGVAEKFGLDKTNAIIFDVKESVKSLALAATEQDDDQLAAAVTTVLDELRYKWTFDESAINDMGYRYLQQHGSPTIAKHVFTYNLDAHPKSANAYSSLADAYSELHMVELAIKNYRLALAIDPDDGYAQEMLGRISQK